MAKVVLLYSSAGGNLPQQKKTTKVEQWLTIKKLDIERVDGANAEFAPIRNQLFGISGNRTYPQVFKNQDGNYTLLGDYDQIEYLIESEQFDQHITDVARIE